MKLVMSLALIAFASAAASAFSSLDTAILPITVNTAADITATPLSMIEGINPAQSFSFTVAAGSTANLLLPVDTDDQSGLKSSRNPFSEALSFSMQGGNISLCLPARLSGGNLLLQTLSGVTIGRQKLGASARQSLSLWGIAAGCYVLSVEKGSETFARTISLESGDCRIQTLFAETSPAPRTAANPAALATTASYELTISSNDPAYRDSILTVTVNRETNPLLGITLAPAVEPSIPFSDLLDSSTYEQFFPQRYSKNGITGAGQPDFYTYRSLLNALSFLADFEATVYTKVGAGGDRVIVTRKSSGEIHEYITVSGYLAQGGTETSRFVDYSKLFNEGSAEIRKQELCAYLANASQETTGGWSTASPSQWAWGLCFIHESPLDETTKDDRFTEDNIYGSKATLEWSYHGRGPKQLTYNYNYGMLSDFVYFDKWVLLNDPNIIARDAKMAWVSSLWFWMTSQGQKPSCHDVMVGTWVPTSADIAAGRTTSKMGMTINIINGGVECGSGKETNIRALGRKSHYEYFCGFMGIAPEANCGCFQMQPY